MKLSPDYMKVNQFVYHVYSNTQEGEMSKPRHWGKKGSQQRYVRLDSGEPYQWSQRKLAMGREKEHFQRKASRI